MKLSKKPWMKFYTADWRANVKLRMCSLGARGLWIEMICLMHQGAPYGHLTIPDSDGKPPSNMQLAMLVGATVQEVETLLLELEAAAVFFRNKSGIIYSRRMIEDEKKLETAVKNGRGGGNPTLRKTRQNSPSDNHQLNGHDNTPDNPSLKARARTYARHPDTREERTTVLSSTVDGQDARPERSREAPRPALEGGPPAPLTLPSGVTWDRMLSPEHPRYGTWFDRARPGRMWFEDMWGPPPGQPGSQVSAADLEAILADHAAIAARSSP